MANNIIVSAIAGYQYKDISLFIESIAKNTSCQLILLASDLNQESVRLINRFRCVSIQVMKFEPPIPPKSMGVQRFFIFKEILSKIEFDNVLLTDARDVFFQSDPFIKIPEKSLIFYREPITIGNCKINSSWIERDFGSQTLNKLSRFPVLCCGTILGEKNKIQDFLSYYCKMMASQQQQLGTLSWAFDQSTLNKLVYDEENHWQFEIKGNEDGEVATLHYQSQFFMNRQGFLINPSGAIIPVLHQYDRFPWLEKHLSNSLR